VWMTAANGVRHEGEDMEPARLGSLGLRNEALPYAAPLNGQLSPTRTLLHS
jgi:hypothetical protein